MAGFTVMSETNWSLDELNALKCLEMFATLKDELKNQAVGSWERFEANPGEMVVDVGESKPEFILVLINGQIRLTGGRTVSATVGDNKRPILGLQNVLLELPLKYQAMASLPSVCARMSVSAFESLLENDQSFKCQLQQQCPPADKPVEDNIEGAIKPSFEFLQEWHGKRPWGNVLDAGTGGESLRWILRQPTDSWTAITGDPFWTKTLTDRFGSRFRPQDRLIEHNWIDGILLEHETFDIVLADYLLGAIERFSPYFQIDLWSRLRPHVSGLLYITGLEPYDLEKPKSDAGRLVLEIVRFRDSLLTMTGSSKFREYPIEWVEKTLRSSGFAIQTSKQIPKRFWAPEINMILDSCLRFIPKLSSLNFGIAVAERIAELRQEIMSTSDVHMGILFGKDYVVVAHPVDD